MAKLFARPADTETYASHAEQPGITQVTSLVPIAVWRASIEQVVSYDVDDRFRRSDGVYRWFHVYARPQRDAQGSIVAWYALLADMDERKKAAENLEGQEVDLWQNLDLTPASHWGDERLFVNRVALDYLTSL